MQAVPKRFMNLLKDVRWQVSYLKTYLLARYRRSRLGGVIFVGITGSAGKTTAKDLTSMVLSSLGPCHSSLLSHNRPIGVAETILGTTRWHRACVAEVSASRPGFLDRPVRMLRPDISVVTLIARDHYSAFRSLEAIADEKEKLVTGLTPGGVAVLNIDDPLVRAMGERCKGRVIWVGSSEGATLRVREVRSDYPAPLTLQVEYQGSVYEVATKLHGTHMALSVLTALGVGVAAGVRLEAAIAALANARPSEGRMEIVKCNDGVVFLRDDWKAPHWSMQAPLEFLGNAKAARKVAVIGSISDSAWSPAKRNTRFARDALQVADLVVFVGPDAQHALKAGPLADNKVLKAFLSIEEAAAFLRTELRAGDLVLLKGSNRVDHLVRLVLDRDKRIGCWRDRCEMKTFCNRCSHAYERPAEVTKLPFVRPLPSLSIPEVPPMPVLVGLGNPGAHYNGTPHNVGHRLLDRLAHAYGGEWEEQAEGEVCTVIMDGVSLKLLKPGVSINRSGPPIRAFLERVKTAPSACIVVHDDMDIPLGEARFKQGGSDAGHKGVRSVAAALGTDAVGRIRVGVRPAGDMRQAREVVLARLSPEQEALLMHGIERAATLVREQLRRGVVVPQREASCAADVEE